MTLSRRDDIAHPLATLLSEHLPALHLLQSGVDITVIALWLGHENPSATHMYIEADLSMKERALQRLQPLSAKASRYKPPDQLMQFLVNL
jgi:site-specific recombinase XerD